MIVGIIKPKGPTSNNIVQEVKRITGRKVGHAGTLDPLASGVLVLGIGKSTKELDSVVKKEKEYVSTFELGAYSTTDDAEGEKTEIEVGEIPDLEKISEVIKNFVGEISQVPPKFSAVKVNGREAYKLARRGKEVKLGPRKVKVEKIEILDYDYPLLVLKIITGPGVYIRSLARDIGEGLGTGGYIKELERTRVGEFSKGNSYTVEDFKNLWQEIKK
jgi:tRNA pseudouridine55 synthase